MGVSHHRLYCRFARIAVPVKIRGNVVAVLNVEDERVGRFTSDDERLMELFSEHIAFALQRIKLLGLARKSLARIEAINRHTLHLASLKTVDEVAEYSFTVIDEVLGFSDGCIGVVEGDVIKFRYARNLTFLVPDIPISGRGVTARACRSGESHLVPDTRLDPDFLNNVDSAEYLSELDVPVKVDGRVVAVINLEGKRLVSSARRIVSLLRFSRGTSGPPLRELSSLN